MTMQAYRPIVVWALSLLLLVPRLAAAERFVEFSALDGTTRLCSSGEPLRIGVSDDDDIAVLLAARNLGADFTRVLGIEPQIVSLPAADLSSGDAASSRSNAPLSKTAAGGCAIVAGTLGHCKAIDAWAAKGYVDAAELKGKTEKYIIRIVDGQVLVAGSDRRGTVYGIYELSRQIGVSPWYYWLDAPIARQTALYVKDGTYTDGEPAVRYRGLFLNDEAPCLTSWVRNTFGTDYGDHRFYEKVFELILRLKGNYLWPAMWGWAFYADDPANMLLADQMGVVVGTSHHEPMARDHQEWARHRDEYGPWNYRTNQHTIDDFFRQGIERISTGGHEGRAAETLVTIGMRGDGDEAMSSEADTRLLETIVRNQRSIIRKVTGKPASETPQVWALYKEVLDYYDRGMRVPDDVIMLMCDDNWGDVRRTPLQPVGARKKADPSGGWGLYYHVDYVGAPRNSKTLNVTPTQNMVEQLSLAYDSGIDKLWILNVGDLKPMEYQIQVFMDMAYYGHGIQGFTPAEQQEGGLGVIDVMPHTTAFCTSLFGEAEGPEAARLLSRCCQLSGRCTPEMLDARTYSLPTGEWAAVVAEWQTLETEALRQYATLPAACRDAYYQLILFPVQLMANLHQMYHAVAMNHALHARGDAAMNGWADRCEACFQRDAELMHQYNKEMAGGKWDGMMTQKHIGYTSWNDDFPHDMLPRLFRTAEVENIFSPDDTTVDGLSSRGYIAIEAEHFHRQEGHWVVIPQMGRTLSGITTADGAPQSAGLQGDASLTYAFELPEGMDEVKVHVITKSTLDYLNQGGMTYSLSLDGGEPATVNFNADLNESPENIYRIYYPTVAGRVVEKTVTLPVVDTGSGMHELKYTPHDAHIVLEKIVIDFGGYQRQYLFGRESRRK